MDHQARVVLGLFARTDRITTYQVAEVLGLSDRMARDLISDWVKVGWLVVDNPSNRARAYKLSAVYRQYIGSLPAKKRTT